MPLRSGIGPSAPRLALAVGLLIMACGDEPTVIAIGPSLLVEPAVVEFGNVRLGEPTTRTVSIINDSEDALHLGIETEGPFDAEVPLANLAPRSHIAVDITLRADAPGPARGHLVARAERDRVEIPLRGLVGTSCLPTNECNEAYFDPESSSCVELPLADGTACGQSDCLMGGRCVGGACYGSPMACADAVPCTVDICDGRGACTNLPDDSACVSDDPCMAGRCDPAIGCVFEPAPDGTVCGPRSCSFTPTCLSAKCLDMPLPEALQIRREWAVEDPDVSLTPHSDGRGGVYWQKWTRDEDDVVLDKTIVAATSDGAIRWSLSGEYLDEIVNPWFLTAGGDLNRVRHVDDARLLWAGRYADLAGVDRMDLRQSIRAGDGIVHVFRGSGTFHMLVKQAPNGTVSWRSTVTGSRLKLIADETGTVFLQGHDTTGMEPEWTLWRLNPDDGSLTILPKGPSQSDDDGLFDVRFNTGIDGAYRGIFIGKSAETRWNLRFAVLGRDTHTVTDTIIDAFNDGFLTLPAVISDAGIVIAGRPPGCLDFEAPCNRPTHLYAFEHDGTLRWARALGGMAVPAPMLTSRGSVILGVDKGEWPERSTTLLEIGLNGREILRCPLGIHAGVYAVIGDESWIVRAGSSTGERSLGIYSFRVPGLQLAKEGWVTSRGAPGRPFGAW